VGVQAFREARLSACVHLHIEAHGGHVGYLSSDASRLAPRKWLRGALAHYFEELCAQLSCGS